ncbi:arginine methyltransferase-interacting protein [Encephalitozoon romaleae SJ-2008]|uniref:Arginine methyltransferase-interacting protein n=1 Tax=Encephalitozoon romaleae (strain SJ-2008) TaxID=1178016 RepID=I7AQ79_ENCRO|nr:arginine methyltransferase-interacting protein [Encephalitozoon romaleae SJ-2008]AFN84034.1 arginine methyltransferase-interacting protein [Encephalitozoon romaleae SJ-2008]
MKKPLTLLDYAKDVKGIKTVELEDLDICLLDPHISLEKIDTNTLYNILGLVYHFEDVKTENKTRASTKSTNSKPRYFCDTTTCFRCGEMSHEFRECTKTFKKDICVLCSRNGHVREQCPCRYCTRCRGFGHSLDVCPSPRDLDMQEMCKACPAGKHSIEDCPRVWKRYKLNGNTSRYTIYKACPKCFSRNHFIDDCSSSDRAQSSIFNSSYFELANFYNKQ